MGTKSETGPLAPLLLGVEVSKPLAWSGPWRRARWLECLQLETSAGIAREDAPRRCRGRSGLKKRIALSDQWKCGPFGPGRKSAATDTPSPPPA